MPCKGDRKEIPSPIWQIRKLSVEGGRKEIFTNSLLVWNAIGYSAEQRDFAYLLAYLISIFLGECVNFLLQRNFTFRSHGKLMPQITGYFFACMVITIIVNSINCVWVAVASQLVPDFIYNIGTTVLNGGVSMIVLFVVNKMVFQMHSRSRGNEKRKGLQRVFQYTVKYFAILAPGVCE